MFKRLLNISADVPSDFDGVPLLNNQKSHFFGFRPDRKPDDIENLWRLFVKVVKKEDFENEYNALFRAVSDRCKYHDGFVLGSTRRLLGL